MYVCVGVLAGRRMAQGYAIPLLGTNVTLPVFTQYLPNNKHTHTHSDVEYIQAAAAGRLPQGVVHCLEACLCLSRCKS